MTPALVVAWGVTHQLGTEDLISVAAVSHLALTSLSLSQD